MATIIKADYDNYAIDRLTVAQLKEALVHTYNGGGCFYTAAQIQGLKRDDLRQCAYHVRDGLKADVEAEAARVEAERQSQIHAEVALGAVKIGHEAIVAALREQYNKDKATIAKFQAEVATSNVETSNIVQRMEWETDDVFLAWERMSEVAGLMRFFEKQVAEQTKTVAEIREWIGEYAKDTTTRVLSVNTSQSTNPVANVRTMQALKAQGWLAKLVTRLHNSYTRIVVEGKTGEARYLGFCL